MRGLPARIAAESRGFGADLLGNPEARCGDRPALPPPGPGSPGTPGRAPPRPCWITGAAAGRPAEWDQSVSSGRGLVASPPSGVSPDTLRCVRIKRRGPLLGERRPENANERRGRKWGISVCPWSSVIVGKDLSSRLVPGGPPSRDSPLLVPVSPRGVYFDVFIFR